jgi:hypothetical protein
MIHKHFIGAVSLCVMAALPSLASADIVTGTVKPANARVTVVKASGEKVADLKPGAYQLQLPVGKYRAQCEAPSKKTQDLLVLSEPVTIDIDCT